MSRIIVNYRRDDVPAEARRIGEGLAAHFGRADVVVDIDRQSAANGPSRPVEAADIVVAVVGPRWLELMRAHSARGERDAEREEIAAALKRGTAVIAVRVGREGAMPLVPRAEDLPEDIRALALRPWRDVTLERIGSDTAGLMESIRRARGVTAAAPTLESLAAAAAPPARHPGNSGIKLWLWSIGAAASAVLVANLTYYLSGYAYPTMSGASQSPGRPSILVPSEDSRIRRAMAAAAAAGRRVAEAQRCQSSLISAAASGTIVFETASAEIDRRSHQTLDALAQIVRSCPDFVIEVEGHTDNVGEAASNQRLSERRARAVRDYLVRVGVPDTSLSSIGYGDTRPVALNDTPSNMARNRRIEFNVTVR